MFLQVDWNTSGEVVIATTIEAIRDSFGQHIGQHSSLAKRHGIEIYRVLSDAWMGIALYFELFNGARGRNHTFQKYHLIIVS